MPLPSPPPPINTSPCNYSPSYSSYSYHAPYPLLLFLPTLPLAAVPPHTLAIATHMPLPASPPPVNPSPCNYSPLLLFLYLPTCPYSLLLPHHHYKTITVLITAIYCEPWCFALLFALLITALVMSVRYVLVLVSVCMFRVRVILSAAVSGRGFPPCFVPSVAPR